MIDLTPLNRYVDTETGLPAKIFLAGGICSGKGFIAEQLVQAGYTERAWSDPVYAAVAARYNKTVAELKANKSQYREALQELGTSARHTNGPNVWIDEWFRANSHLDLVVESGTRFPNEVEWAKAQGGFVIRVETPLELRQQRHHDLHGCYITREQLNHESEQMISRLPVDAEISGALSAQTILPRIKQLVSEFLYCGPRYYVPFTEQ